MKAVIFDMDGVIVDTMDLHFKAGAKVLNEEGARADKQDLEAMDSTRTQEIFRKFLAAKSEPEIKGLVEKKYRYLLAKTKGIKPFPGFLEFFFRLKGNYKLGLVSSSIRSFVEFILSELEIRNSFAVIVCGDEITRGKPDPEGYLLAAQKLGVKPSECLVVEDSVYGVMSAKAAGMKVVAVTNTYEKNFLLGADLVVDSLAELTIKKCEALFHA